jgi:two-component system nitrate/nitrite response regulator NarL
VRLQRAQSKEANVSDAIRVVLADGESLFVEGLELLLRSERDIEVTGAATSLEAAMQKVRQRSADVLLAGQQLADGSALDLVRQIRSEGLTIAVVLLARAVDDAQVFESMRLGIAGIVLKTMPARLLFQCIRKVHSGGEWVEKESVGRALHRLLRSQQSAAEHAAVLSVREMDVVRAVATGLRNRQVADRLFISESTVKVHLNNIFDKLNVSSRIQLTLYAQANGLV